MYWFQDKSEPNKKKMLTTNLLCWIFVFFRDILRSDLIFIKTTNERCYLEWKIFPKYTGGPPFFLHTRFVTHFERVFFTQLKYVLIIYLSIRCFFANNNASMYPIHSFIHLVSQWIYDIHSYKMPKKTTKTTKIP